MSTENPRKETLYKELLTSEKWDVPNAPPPRLRYAIFSSKRTGSELLCARLRLEGIGIPLEYFNTDAIARRLGCVDSADETDVPTYIRRLEAVRTTPNGVFGVKIQPQHLDRLNSGDSNAAGAFLRLFDKIVLLRRRDLLLQAISMARSELTGQWHVLPGDDVRRVAVDDARLFRSIDTALERIERGDRIMARAESSLDPGRIRATYYEDMIMPGGLEPLIDWIAAGVERRPVDSEATPDFALPEMGNRQESEEIRSRYLAARPGGRNATGRR